MAIASLVLGIISLIISLIPIFGFIAVFPAITSLVLGIVSLVVNNKNSNVKKGNGSSITGVILSSISFVIMLFWFVVLVIFSINYLDDDYNNYRYKNYNKNRNTQIQRFLDDKFDVNVKVKI